MLFIILIIILWILFPFFGIPFSIAVKSQNTKLKARIEELEFENKKLRYLNSENAPSAESSEAIPEAVPEVSDVINNQLSADEQKAADNSEETVSAAESSTDNRKPEFSEAVFPDESEKTENQKVRNVSGLLITGVSMILVAGLVFVTTNWSVLGNGVKIFLMMLATALFFGSSSFSGKKLGIHSTSKGFYILGTLFVPITCISFFFFEIFGEWLSFTGDGRWLAFMSVFLSCAASCMLITRKYQAQFFAFSAMMFISAAVASAGFFTGSFTGAMILAAVFSALLLLVKPESLTRLHVHFIYSEIFKLYSRVSAFSFAFVMLIYAMSDGSTSEGAAVMAFLMAVTVYIQFNTVNTSYEITCRIFSAVEYIIFAAFVTNSAYDSSLFGEKFSYELMFNLICIPAFVVFAFVPMFKSAASKTIVICALFIKSMTMFTSAHPLGAVIILAMAVISAADKKAYSNVIAVLISVPVLWQLLENMNAGTLTIALVLSVTVSVVFAAAVFGAERFPQLNVTAAAVSPYIVFIPLFTSLVFSEPVSLTAGGCAVLSFVLASYILGRRNIKGFSILSCAFAVIYAQIMMLVLSDRFILTGYSESEKCVSAYFISITVMAVLLAAGYLIKRADRVSGLTVAYLSALMPFMAIIFYSPESGSNLPLVIETAYIVYCIACGYISEGKVLSKVFYTVASAFTAFILTGQHFFEVPELIRPEYNLLAFLVPYIFIFRIWRENRETVDLVMFIQSIISMMVLVSVAISEGELFHALAIGVICVAIIIVTAFTKDRKWRIFANVTLVLLTFYMTKDFWASLAWWVYLLTAGVILVGYAAFNEYCRKTGTENMIKNEIESMIDSVKNKQQ